MPKRRSRRRGNNEGTIFRRSTGQWVVQLTVQAKGGGTKRISRHAKSQEEGQILLAELKAQYVFEPNTSPLTVRQLLLRWYRSNVKRKAWEQSTQDTKRRAIKNRILKPLGKYTLLPRKTKERGGIRIRRVERWLERMQQKGVGQRTIQIAFDTLRTAFVWGIERGLAHFNPCLREIRPKATAMDIFPFTDEELRAILNQVVGDRYEALHHLAFTAGPRQGELFGLQWRDVDWENSTIRIERQARYYAGKVTVKTPKTRSGRRTIAVSASVVEKLHERRKQAVKEGAAKPEDFIFLSKEGCVIRRTNFGRRHWRSLLKALGIKHRGYHHVRHTAATKMLRTGTDVQTVAHIIGHSSASTTYRLYSHYMPGDGKVAAEKMQTALSRLTS